MAGIEPEVISKTLREFGGVAHRIEYCGEVDGVKFYNDSKGTNTDATITALKALKKNIILLAGGDAKKQDFAPLAAELSGKVKHMMLYGRDAGDIKEAADAAGFNSYTMVKNLEEATNLAFEMAQPGRCRCCFHLHAQAGICTATSNRGEITLKFLWKDWDADGNY